MENKKKYIISLILILVILLVGAFFIFNTVTNSNGQENINSLKNSAKNLVSGNSDSPEYSPEGEVPQTIENPEVIDSNSTGDPSSSKVDNTDVSKTLEPTDDMKKVISDNKNDLNDSDVIDQMAQSYPSNLIPLYKAKSAADSSDIVTPNGNPGWTAIYGSDAVVPEIADFYSSLLSSTGGYKVSDNGDSKTITGTVDNCDVKVTVTPNNPERTGLNDQSNVDIYIERK